MLLRSLLLLGLCAALGLATPALAATAEPQKLRRSIGVKTKVVTRSQRPASQKKARGQGDKEEGRPRN